MEKGSQLPAKKSRKRKRVDNQIPQGTEAEQVEPVDLSTKRGPVNVIARLEQNNGGKKQREPISKREKASTEASVSNAESSSVSRSTTSLGQGPKPSTSKALDEDTQVVLNLTHQRKDSPREVDPMKENLNGQERGEMRSPMRSGLQAAAVKVERNIDQSPKLETKFDSMDIVEKANLVQELADPLKAEIERLDPESSGLWREISKYLGRKLEKN